MNKYIEQIKKTIKIIIPQKEEGVSETEYRNLLLIRGVQTALFLFAALAILRGAITVLPDSITVSNSVNGRELPIYCVQTDKKQVALSFDAAWGNG